MNDRNNMDSTGTVNSDDVLVANETNVTDKRESVCHGQFNCGRHFRRLIVYFCFAMAFVFGVIGFMDLKANASENNVYVDEEYLQEQFGAYKNYAILTDGQGNYVTIYSEVDIAVSTSTCNIYSFNTNNYMGYKTMKIEDGVLYIDENGSSNYNRFTVTQTYKYLGVDVTYNDILYSNNDVKAIMWVNGSPKISDEIVHSVADNIGTKPVEEPTPDVTVDCKFTDEKIVESINALNENLVVKMDIVIMLLIVIIALRMFSPLANNHKRGLEKKGN